jgi:methyl-accepting chemotaxis protein
VRLTHNRTLTEHPVFQGKFCLSQTIGFSGTLLGTMMKNLKISAKLGFCFAILFAALLALGSLSIVKLSGIGALASDIAGGRLEKLDAAAAITAAAVQYRADEANHILEPDAQHRAPVAEDLRRQRDLVDQKLAWLDQTVTKPEMRAAMAAFKQEWTAYLQRSTPMLALSDQDLDPQASAAYDDGKAGFDRMHDAAAHMQTVQSKVMADLAGTAEATYVQSRNVVIVSIIAVAALVTAMLIALVRGISHPLAAMSGALNALAGGSMNAEVPVDDRRDEVGDLATAMKGLRDQLAAAAQARRHRRT